MKIVADDKIPFLRGVFEPYGVEVSYINGGAIGSDDLCDADAMIIRTRTKCDAALLDGSRVSMVATATIGFDHVDTEYCKQQNIEVVTAAGCNARAVAQYVMAALVTLDKKPEATLGVVGVGNVGSVVCSVARSLGYRVLMNDPPRAAREREGDFVELDELVKQADVITFHVPLDGSTRDLVSAELLSLVKPGVVVINSSRGEIMDEVALADCINKGKVSHAVLDVWRNEPNINPHLMTLATIATPHIAGYSLQGKAMGTAMTVRAVAAKFGITELLHWYPTELVLPTTKHENITWQELTQGLKAYCDILSDSAALKQKPQNFEQLRGEYKYRNEFF